MLSSLGMFLALLAAPPLGIVLKMWRIDRELAAQAIKSAGHPFTTTVDWYKPVPEDHAFVRGFVDGFEIPPHLFVPVQPSLREQATILLGDNDIIALTEEQAAQLAPGADPESVLRSTIARTTEELRFFSRPEQEQAIQLLSEREQAEARANGQGMIDRFSSEIKELQRWESHLRPYLIKAVGLQAAASFSGTFISEGELMVIHGALGLKHRVPMERRVVVAFLPIKPHKVYTALGWMQ